MSDFIPLINVRQLYDQFDAPVARLDCGAKCAPHNPKGIPFCCDICEAVPAAYHQEWQYLQANTDLWHEWRGDECPTDPGDPDELRADTPEHMRLLACQGPARCQRPYRAMSCRQFPFFPYVSSKGRFLGLAYYWEYEPTCWVISNLGEVTDEYRQQFVQVYDGLFAAWQEEFDGYAYLSEDLRAHFAAQKRSFPLLHRKGGHYLVHPLSERLRRVTPQQFNKYGPYAEAK